MSDLEPCPFCGSDRVSISTGWADVGRRRFYMVECDACTASGPHSELFDKHAESPADFRAAVDGWNRRKGAAT